MSPSDFKNTCLSVVMRCHCWTLKMSLGQPLFYNVSNRILNIAISQLSMTYHCQPWRYRSVQSLETWALDLKNTIWIVQKSWYFQVIQLRKLPELSRSSLSHNRRCEKKEAVGRTDNLRTHNLSEAKIATTKRAWRGRRRRHKQF